MQGGDRRESNEDMMNTNSSPHRAKRGASNNTIPHVKKETAKVRHPRKHVKP